MLFLDNLLSSIAVIMSHKVRTFLTLLGLIIGVFAVVTMFSAVSCVKTMMNKAFEEANVSTSFTVINKGENQDNQRWWQRKNDKRESKPINISDYYLLRSELDCDYIYTTYSSWQYNSRKTKNKWDMLKGVNNDYLLTYRKYKMYAGRLFSKIEYDKKSKVCLLGSKKWQTDYNSDLSIIGKKIKLGQEKYTVVGVIGVELEDEVMFNFGGWEKRFELKSFFIPIDTAVALYSKDGKIESITVKSKDENAHLYNKNRAWQLLLQNHNMTKSFEFEKQNQSFTEIMDQVTGFIKKWNMTLMAIASISLLVGGIGLFSTLLISISERMNEIGVRKSIGARSNDIFVLLLSESLVLSLMGSLFGIGVAGAVIMVINHFAPFVITMPITGVLVGIGFSLLIGFLSGLYPAIKASKINTIEAIYYFE